MKNQNEYEILVLLANYNDEVGKIEDTEKMREMYLSPKDRYYRSIYPKLLFFAIVPNIFFSVLMGGWTLFIFAAMILSVMVTLIHFETLSNLEQMYHEELSEKNKMIFEFKDKFFPDVSLKKLSEVSSSVLESLDREVTEIVDKKFKDFDKDRNKIIGSLYEKEKEKLLRKISAKDLLNEALKKDFDRS